MKTRILVMFTLALLVIMPAIAQQTQPAVETKGLTAEQINSLNTVADQLRKQPNTLANFTLQNATPDKFKEWADAGAAAGKAVSSFTKEVGIAADSFIKTDTGRLLVLAVLWKAGGGAVIASLLNVILKVILAALLFTFWWKATRRFVFNEVKTGFKTYNPNTFLRWLGFNKKEVKYESDTAWLDRFEKEENRFWIVQFSRIGSAIMLVAITVICWPSVSF